MCMVPNVMFMCRFLYSSAKGSLGALLHNELDRVSAVGMIYSCNISSGPSMYSIIIVLYSPKK